MRKIEAAVNPEDLHRFSKGFASPRPDKSGNAGIFPVALIASGLSRITGISLGSLPSQLRR